MDVVTSLIIALSVVGGSYLVVVGIHALLMWLFVRRM